MQAAWPERSVGNPFLDRLPGRLDGLHGVDVEGWWGRAREMDDSLPEAVEAEEKLIQGRPTALHPCGARHPLRGFLSKTPTSLRRFSISSCRRKVRTGFLMPLQQGHSKGSPPHTRRMRSRHRGRMSRALHLGGAGMRRIWVRGACWDGGLGLGWRMMRSGMGEVWPRDLLE